MQALKRSWNSQNADYLIYRALHTFCQDLPVVPRVEGKTIQDSRSSTVERSYSCNFWSVEVLFKIQEIVSCLQGFVLLSPCLCSGTTEKHGIPVHGMNVNLQWRWFESMQRSSTYKYNAQRHQEDDVSTRAPSAPFSLFTPGWTQASCQWTEAVQ